MVGAFLAWTMLSEMLGAGIGPGVSQDRRPLPQDQGYYQFNQNTKHEYENAVEDRRRGRRRNEQLFESFYQREMNQRK